MDSLFSRLLLKTADLRDQRAGLNTLGPQIFNLCVRHAEQGNSTRDINCGLYTFEQTNMNKNIIMVENIQAILNGRYSSGTDPSLPQRCLTDRCTVRPANQARQTYGRTTGRLLRSGKCEFSANHDGRVLQKLPSEDRGVQSSRGHRPDVCHHMSECTPHSSRFSEPSCRSVAPEHTVLNSSWRFSEYSPNSASKT